MFCIYLLAYTSSFITQCSADTVCILCLEVLINSGTKRFVKVLFESPTVINSNYTNKYMKNELNTIRPFSTSQLMIYLQHDTGERLISFFDHVFPFICV